MSSCNDKSLPYGLVVRIPGFHPGFLAELLSGYETGHCGRPRSTGRGLRVHFKRETRALHLFSLAVFFIIKIMLQKARRGKEINRGVVDQPFSHLYFSAKMKKAKGCMGEGVRRTCHCSCHEQRTMSKLNKRAGTEYHLSSDFFDSLQRAEKGI